MNELILLQIGKNGPRSNGMKLSFGGLEVKSQGQGHTTLALVSGASRRYHSRLLRL